MLYCLADGLFIENSTPLNLFAVATAAVAAFVCRSNGFITNDYRLMASSLVKMGAADGEVDVNAFAFDIEKVIDSLSSVEAQLDTSAVIDEDTGTVSYGTSVNFDQEVKQMKAHTYCCGRAVLMQ